MLWVTASSRSTGDFITWGQLSAACWSSTSVPISGSKKIQVHIHAWPLWLHPAFMVPFFIFYREWKASVTSFSHSYILSWLVVTSHDMRYDYHKLQNAYVHDLLWWIHVPTRPLPVNQSIHLYDQTFKGDAQSHHMQSVGNVRRQTSV